MKSVAYHLLFDFAHMCNSNFVGTFKIQLVEKLILAHLVDCADCILPDVLMQVRPVHFCVTDMQFACINDSVTSSIVECLCVHVCDREA